MEGLDLSFLVCYNNGMFICEVNVPCGVSTTVGALKEAIYHHCKALQAACGDGGIDELNRRFVILCMERQLPLQDDDLVSACFPNAVSGEKFRVTFVERNPSPAPAAPAAPASSSRPSGTSPSSSGGPVAQRPSRDLRDLAVKAAKTIRAAGRVDEDRMANALMEQLSDRSLEELAEFKKPGGATAKRGGGGGASVGKVDQRQLEWTKFYTAILEDVRAAMDAFERHNGQVVVGLVVEPTMTVEQFAAEAHLPSEFATVQQWVKDADMAVRTCQRFAIANAIVLGSRLSEVRTRWDRLKGAQEAVSRGIHTLDAFYQSLGLGYTVDYIRKLIHIGKLGSVFPNLALISCCGIGEVIKFMPEFMEMMKSSSKDAIFWRCSARGTFGWTRVTSVLAYEGTKRQKVLDYHEMAPDELHQDWVARGTNTMTNIIAETEAAKELESGEAEQLAQAIDEAIAGIERE